LELRQRTPDREVSMSTSLLYHAFGIRGYQYTRTDYQDGQVIFTIHQDPQSCRCPACGSPQVKSRGHVERRFRTVPIGRRRSRPTVGLHGLSSVSMSIQAA
jgi:hypothetical protein